jgi:hypothetical protein
MHLQVWTSFGGELLRHSQLVTNWTYRGFLDDVFLPLCMIPTHIFHPTASHVNAPAPPPPPSPPPPSPPPLPPGAAYLPTVRLETRIASSMNNFDAVAQEAFKLAIAILLGIDVGKINIFPSVTQTTRRRQLQATLDVLVIITTSNLTDASTTAVAIQNLTASTVSAATGQTVTQLDTPVVQVDPIMAPSPPPPLPPPPSPPPPSPPPSMPPPWWELRCPPGYEQASPRLEGGHRECHLCPIGKYQAGGLHSEPSRQTRRWPIRGL